MTKWNFYRQPENWNPDWEWKQISRYRFNEMTTEEIEAHYPDAVTKGKEYGLYQIQLFEYQQKLIKKDPKDFRIIADHFGCPYPIKDYEIIERRVGNDVFSEWYENTEHRNEMYVKTQNQIVSYYKSLVNDSQALTDTRDSIKDAYGQWRLARKIEETKKIL